MFSERMAMENRSEGKRLSASFLTQFWMAAVLLGFFVIRVLGSRTVQQLLIWWRTH